MGQDIAQTGAIYRLFDFYTNKADILTKSKTPLNDPHAEREARKYGNPIASRELILELLDRQPGPATHPELADLLGLTDDDDIEALRRRLIAMARDGQLISNRRGAYARVDLMDMVRA